MRRCRPPCTRCVWSGCGSRVVLPPLMGPASVPSGGPAASAAANTHGLAAERSCALPHPLLVSRTQGNVPIRHNTCVVGADFQHVALKAESSGFDWVRGQGAPPGNGGGT